MTEYVFAKCKDHRGLLYYLMAETVDEVYEYCDNYRTVPKGRQMDLFDKEGLAVEQWTSDITPAMAQSHFTWVGKRTNPFVVAKPIYLKDENNNYLGKREFKEKW